MCVTNHCVLTGLLHAELPRSLHHVHLRLLEVIPFHRSPKTLSATPSRAVQTRSRGPSRPFRISAQRSTAGCGVTGSPLPSCTPSGQGTVLPPPSPGPRSAHSALWAGVRKSWHCSLKVATSDRKPGKSLRRGSSTQARQGACPCPGAALLVLWSPMGGAAGERHGRVLGGLLPRGECGPGGRRRGGACAGLGVPRSGMGIGRPRLGALPRGADPIRRVTAGPGGAGSAASTPYARGRARRVLGLAGAEPAG